MPEKNLSISGSINISDAVDSSGPLFLVLSYGNDPNQLLSDPYDRVQLIASIDKSNPDFTIDLENTSFRAGDVISIISFIDNNYHNGIPYPDKGDYLGIYFDKNSYTSGYALKEDGNTGITVDVCRIVNDFNIIVSGLIHGTESGEVTVLAYAGDISTLDISTLDLNAIIGYRRMTKSDSPAPYSINIFPFGNTPPINNVYLVAFIDKNANGKPDGLDRLGFYTTDPQKLPTPVTLCEGLNSNLDITMTMDIPSSSGVEMSLKGFFEKPAGYDSFSRPVFILIAGDTDPNILFFDPLSVIKTFQRIPSGDYTFDIDVSNTGLAPGMDVMVMALWDRDYSSGFPDPTEDDMVGFFQNNSLLKNTITLKEGINTVEPFGDWDFNVKRKIYNHSAEIAFQFDNGDLPDEYTLKTGDQILVIAVHKDGYSDPAINDMDYIVAMSTVTYQDSSSWYSCPVSPAISESIPISSPFGLNDLYLFAILDSNKNGKPDEGEYIGFYWSWYILFYAPRLFNIVDGMNELDRTVRFASRQY